jgi:RNase P/RNase MRP subunit p29
MQRKKEDKKLNDLFASEFIGMHIEIIDSKNLSFKKNIGKIIDESKETLSIRTEEGFIKKIIKKPNTIRFIEKNIIVEGKEIIIRPEERIKKWFKNKKKK